MVRRPPRLVAGLATSLLLGLGTLALPVPSAHADRSTDHGVDDSSSARPAPVSRSGKRRAKPGVRSTEYDAPLEITIDALTPGLLPRKGPLVVRGTVTNVDLEAWDRINLYPMFGAGPGCVGCPPGMTTEDELKDAVATDPESQVGVRDTHHPDVSMQIATLGPGETADYAIRIPQKVLRGVFANPTTGVYWFGVHALGENAQGRDQLADGRARTFLPYVAPADSTRVQTAVVVPLRGRVAHSAAGELGRTERWESYLSPQGTLGGPLAFGTASGTAPVTWLVDPAVPDAVSQLAAGNPTRAVAPIVPLPEPDAGESPTAGADESDDVPTDDSSPDGGTTLGDAPGSPTLAADDPLVRSAQSWLGQAQGALSHNDVALLPYGDPDLAAAAHSLPSIYAAARQQATPTLDAWGITGTPAVMAPNGYLDAAAISRVDDDTTILLGEQEFAEADFPNGPPIGGLVDKRPVVVTATPTAKGGPGPDDALAPVALRQRLLSEAVIRVLAAEESGSSRPVPIVLPVPQGVDAAGAREFWTGLDPALIDLVDLSTVTHANALAAGGSDLAASRQIDTDQLTYPSTQKIHQLETDVFPQAGGLIRAGRSFQRLLGDGYAITTTGTTGAVGGTDLVGEALAGTSYAMRGDADAAPRLGRSRTWVDDQLGQVSIDAPPGVTLSSSSGNFNVALANGLDQAVTVKIQVSSDSAASIEVADSIVLAAHSRASIPVRAVMHGNGVHNVRLQVTDLDGVPIGAEDELPIRSGQVGAVIWVIIGTGAGILFLAIGIRLFRRFRDPDHAAEDDAPATDGDEVTP